MIKKHKTLVFLLGGEIVRYKWEKNHFYDPITSWTKWVSSLS